MSRPDDAEQTPRLLMPEEVGEIFRVDPKTVTRWAHAGRLTAIRTLGGHRRYFRSEILYLLSPTGEKLAALLADAAQLDIELDTERLRWALAVVTEGRAARAEREITRTSHP